MSLQKWLLMLHLWASEYLVSDAAEEAEISLKGWQSSQHLPVAPRGLHKQTSTGTDNLGWFRCDCANR